MSSQEATDTHPEPWYKQFWPWFLIALPASVVVAGFVTLAIAIDSKASLVADDYYKQGLGINRVLAEDKLAQELALQAEMTIDPLTGEVFAQVTGQLETLPSELTLFWIHPVNSEKDQQLTLRQVTNSRYRGQLESALTGRWYVQLRGDKPEPWRLRATTDLGSTTELSSTQRANWQWLM